jgi:hypothetical protein
MIHIWEKTNNALNLIADAIRDEARGELPREHLTEAKQLLAKAQVEIAQLLAAREPK